jgi:hypothetical protein
MLQIFLPTEIFASEYIHIPVVINKYLSTTIDLLCASKEIIYYVSTYWLYKHLWRILATYNLDTPHSANYHSVYIFDHIWVVQNH